MGRSQHTKISLRKSRSHFWVYKGEFRGAIFKIGFVLRCMNAAVDQLMSLIRPPCFALVPSMNHPCDVTLGMSLFGV